MGLFRMFAYTLVVPLKLVIEPRREGGELSRLHLCHLRGDLLLHQLPSALPASRARVQ